MSCRTLATTTTTTALFRGVEAVVGQSVEALRVTHDNSSSARRPTTIAPQPAATTSRLDLRRHPRVNPVASPFSSVSQSFGQRKGKKHSPSWIRCTVQKTSAVQVLFVKPPTALDSVLDDGARRGKEYLPVFSVFFFFFSSVIQCRHPTMMKNFYHVNRVK